jgi:transcriptional regulator with XRE-family HTH domain
MVRTTKQARSYFGEWIDVTLSNKGTKGRSLADEIGVHESAISRWRAGAGVPGTDVLTALADALGLEPLRLFVTAGVVPAEAVHVEPYPIPEPTAQRNSVKRQLNRIRGLTDESRRRLMETYDELIDEESGR